jgi:putative membrane protein
MWDMHDGSGGWMLYGGIMMVVFWALIIWLAVWLISKVTRHEHSGQGPERRDPLDIVKERYARGEISKEEFDRIKQDLS